MKATKFTDAAQDIWADNEDADGDPLVYIVVNGVRVAIKNIAVVRDERGAYVAIIPE